MDLRQGFKIGQIVYVVNLLLHEVGKAELMEIQEPEHDGGVYYVLVRPYGFDREEDSWYRLLLNELSTNEADARGAVKLDLQETLERVRKESEVDIKKLEEAIAYV